MKKEITIGDIVTHNCERGNVTTEQYLVFMEMIKKANGKKDMEAIGRCLSILTRVKEYNPDTMGHGW